LELEKFYQKINLCQLKNLAIDDGLEYWGDEEDDYDNIP
jgi:hypothetical protein